MSHTCRYMPHHTCTLVPDCPDAVMDVRSAGRLLCSFGLHLLDVSQVYNSQLSSHFVYSCRTVLTLVWVCVAAGRPLPQLRPRLMSAKVTTDSPYNSCILAPDCTDAGVGVRCSRATATAASTPLDVSQGYN